MRKYIFLTGTLISLSCLSVGGVVADTLDGYVTSDISIASANAVTTKASDKSTNDLSVVFGGVDGDGLVRDIAVINLNMFADTGGSNIYQSDNLKKNIENMACNSCHAIDRSQPG